MSSTPAAKRVLVAGLGRFIAADHAAQFGSAQANRASITANLEKARQHGFEPSAVELNPNDPAASLKELRELLVGTHFDGFTIGFGIRGKKEFTELFEDVVNLSRELSPKTKLGFSVAPDAVFETLLRMFPEMGEKEE
ncbi:unnamed protein product [Zymoseptoria tritici ST99CH_3D1]|nr:unnamed protein product [Zymoseptoria tritici ST99CH_3D1]